MTGQTAGPIFMLYGSNDMFPCTNDLLGLGQSVTAFGKKLPKIGVE